MARYDHPNVIVRREQSFTTAAGAAGVGARMVNFQKTKLIAATAYVVAAGTSTSPGSALTIKVGTTSVGLIALGSSTISSVLTVDLADVVANSGQLVSATNGTDATASAVVTYEYQVVPESTQSS